MMMIPKMKVPITRFPSQYKNTRLQAGGHPEPPPLCQAVDASRRSAKGRRLAVDCGLTIRVHARFPMVRTSRKIDLDWTRPTVRDPGLDWTT